MNVPANRNRVYLSLDEISTLAKRQKLCKPRAFTQSMRDLEFALNSQASVATASAQDHEIPDFMANAVVDGFKAGASAFHACYISAIEVDDVYNRAVLNLMAAAFSLARALDGSNEPNTAMYALMLKHSASKVLSIALA